MFIRYYGCGSWTRVVGCLSKSSVKCSHTLTSLYGDLLALYIEDPNPPLQMLPHRNLAAYIRPSGPAPAPPSPTVVGSCITMLYTTSVQVLDQA